MAHKPPEIGKAAPARTAPNNTSELLVAGADCSTPCTPVVKPRRNERRHGSWSAPATACGTPTDAACGGKPPTNPRDAWICWLGPHFENGSAAYFTGTYSDEYGFPHGLMLARNVHADFRRFLNRHGYSDNEYIIGVEKHQYRDILHLHAIIGGDFDDIERRLLKAQWQAERGHARALPVLDGCASYITKYALKGDTECFEWNLRDTDRLLVPTTVTEHLRAAGQ